MWWRAWTGRRCAGMSSSPNSSSSVTRSCLSSVATFCLAYPFLALLKWTHHKSISALNAVARSACLTFCRLPRQRLGGGCQKSIRAARHKFSEGKPLPFNPQARQAALPRRPGLACHIQSYLSGRGAARDADAQGTPTQVLPKNSNRQTSKLPNQHARLPSSSSSVTKSVPCHQPSEACYPGVCVCSNFHVTQRIISSISPNSSSSVTRACLSFLAIAQLE